MIYLISQITLIFLNQIYYNMNFITSASISSQDFPDTLRSIFADCFWIIFFCSIQKMYVSECVCKPCLKELGILLKCRDNFETHLKILVFHIFFFKGFWELYFKEHGFPNKNQKVHIMLTFIKSKLTKMIGKDKQNDIFQKSKSNKISSTDIDIGEDCEFIIHVFYWCIMKSWNLY